MKTVRHPRILILFALAMIFQPPAFSQEIITAEEFNPSDNAERGKLISTYREFFKWKEYHLALESWWTLFNDYPDFSEKLYVDGAAMYHQFIEESPEGQARENKVDTLMLIYDRRMEYFGEREISLDAREAICSVTGILIRTR